MASKSTRSSPKPQPAGVRYRPPVRNFLAEWVERAGLGAEVREALVTWLAKQLVSDQFAKLEQGGHQEGGVPLRKVFVDLPITERPVDDTEQGERRFFLRTLLAMSPVPLRGASSPSTPTSRRR
jgi:hypothetical protein